MRTTLDIDEDVLQAAKELAAREQKTAGKLISEWARRGLRSPPDSSPEHGDGSMALRFFRFKAV